MSPAPPLAALLNAFLRHRRLLIWLPFTCMILGGVIARSKRKWTASIAFAPQNSQQNAAGITGIAAQLGLPMTAGTMESPEFYRALIPSRDFLAEVVETRYHFATRRGGRDSLAGTMIELYEIKGTIPVERVTKAVNKMRGKVSVGTDRTSGTVGVRVTTPWAELSEQVAARLLELLNQFNLEKRQTRYGAERKFLEDRLVVARDDLTVAEDRQRRFLERNRSWRDDPTLSVEMQRLTRGVDQAQQVYTQMTQSHEQARMEEVRNTPILTVIQTPTGTARPTPGLMLGLAMGLFLGGMAALTFVLIKEYASRERELNPAAYDEIDAVAKRLRIHGKR